MALFQAILGELRGSIGNDTWSRNRSGNYVRQRTTPVQPGSPGQSLAKDTLTTATQRWRTLTQLQRDNWNTYAENTPTTNKLGETIILNGIDWYLAVNAFTLRGGLGFVDDAPGSFGRAPAVAISFNAQETFQIGGVTDAEGTSQLIQFQWAGPFDQSINFFKGPFPHANIQFFTAAGPFPIVLQDPATIDRRFFVRWRNLDDTNRTGTFSTDTVDIVAIP